MREGEKKGLLRHVLACQRERERSAAEKEGQTRPVWKAAQQSEGVQQQSQQEGAGWVRKGREKRTLKGLKWWVQRWATLIRRVGFSFLDEGPILLFSWLFSWTADGSETESKPGGVREREDDVLPSSDPPRARQKT